MVRLYKKYMSHRPDHLPKCSKDFYLRPSAVPNGDIWYSCQARGHHKLEKVVKEMCKKAGFTGKRTNHSLRAGCATRMYDGGADEQLICEKTGHRSIAVRGYKHTSSHQMREVSDSLYGNVGEGKPKIAKIEASSTVRAPPPEVKSEIESISIENESDSKQNVDSDKTVELSKGFVVNINFNVTK